MIKQANQEQIDIDLEKMLQDPFKGIDPNAVRAELRTRVYKLIKHEIQIHMDSNRVRPYIVKALKYVCDMCSD